MIFFEHVCKFILSDVNIHIPQGTSLGLIGSSGAGKTTFLKLACGLLRPAAGCVHTMRLIPEKNRRKLGTMTGAFFADIPLFRDTDTVESNFQDIKIIYGLGDDLFDKEYSALADRLGFRSFEKEPVKQLSLGQRRRAELGALLLARPKLLLLDEPTEGLDQTARVSLRELLTERQAEGTTLVISSHNMEEISALCERIVLLDHGSLCYYGDKELLLKHFAPDEVMEIGFSGKLPDLEDLPLKHYSLHQNKLKLTYNSNYVTSAELLRHVLAQTTITAVTTKKSGLSDAINKIEKGENHEFY
ncbi:MAG: ATP-binding cassette domain-containing protein [Acetatifactor sp.]|nr:ATP-binding cassette domain-containing protein [Acetatifactor sp.]